MASDGFQQDVAAFDIILVAPNGRVQPIQLQVTMAGICLLDNHKLVSRFSFAEIRRWCPSATRKRSPDASDCLDLQLDTAKGPRELHIRCPGGPEGVHEIMDCLQQTKQAVTEQLGREARWDQAAGLSGAGPRQHTTNTVWSQQQQQQRRQMLGRGLEGFDQSHASLIAPSTLRRTRSDSDRDHYEQQQQQHGHHQQRRGDDRYEEHLGSLDPSRAASFQSAYFNAMFDPQGLSMERVGSASWHPDLDPGKVGGFGGGSGSEAGVSPSRRGGEGGGGRGHTLDRHPEPSLYSPQRTLGQHLPSSSAAAAGAAAGGAHRIQPPGGRAEAGWNAGGRGVGGGVAADDGSAQVRSSPGWACPRPPPPMTHPPTRAPPLPGWLRDRRYLNPLLEAYDLKVAELGSRVAEMTEGACTLQLQVDGVVNENEGLRGALSRALEGRSLAALASHHDGGGHARSGALMAEEASLLKEENTLLAEAQSDLYAEVNRLQMALNDAGVEGVRLAQEAANSSMLAQQHLARMQEAEAKVARALASARSAENRSAGDAAAFAELQTSIASERGSAAATAQTLQELRGVHAQVCAAIPGLEQRAKAGHDAKMALQVELSSARERYDAAAGEAAAAVREGTALRQALTSMEARLSEFQRKDVEVYGRIKGAMEVAEEACLARDALLARQRELQRENESLSGRLAALRGVVKEQVTDEFLAQVSSLTLQLQAAQEEQRAASTQVHGERVRAERLEREQRSLAAELVAMREEAGASHGGKHRIGLMSDVGALERMQELERCRDDATAKLDSTERKLERCGREWGLEKMAMEQGIRSLKQYSVELEGAVQVSRNEVAGLRRGAEAAGREVVSLRAAKALSEGGLRQQITAVRVERDSELQATVAKLEAAVAAGSSSTQEAERLLEAKEDLLARWREEATTIAGRLEDSLESHRRELDERARETEGLRAVMAGMETLSTGSLQHLHDAAARDGPGAAVEADAAPCDLPPKEGAELGRRRTTLPPRGLNWDGVAPGFMPGQALPASVAAAVVVVCPQAENVELEGLVAQLQGVCGAAEQRRAEAQGGQRDARLQLLSAQELVGEMQEERQLLQLQLERAHFDISRTQPKQPQQPQQQQQQQKQSSHARASHQAGSNADTAQLDAHRHASGSSSSSGGGATAAGGDTLLAQYLQLKQQMAAAGREVERVKERGARGSTGSVPPTASFLVPQSEGTLYDPMRTGAGVRDGDGVATGGQGRGSDVVGAGRVRARA
ncbi:MAG: hypothetical protein WDW36_008441 [Sanguina aurantia]